jgi:hypothetical protein
MKDPHIYRIIDHYRVLSRETLGHITEKIEKKQLKTTGTVLKPLGSRPINFIDYGDHKPSNLAGKA